ncbi:PqqD family peptide modification chaperone [Erythrobacter sp. JK5]|uniref:PqqD family peptide modification chaperone n=1 Tax=Erythrobacter sp. JK5 TaxID=2829500 RepID=UPI001BAA6940|nr:PqqD family peptide modification chaperone [Erythrobacter sp. JK5]QUL37818.1 PqqD family protein [Erythrobacter sp. JK5]
MTAPSFAPDTRLTQTVGVVAAEMDGETVMMDIDKGVYFAITGTGSQIWAAMDSPATLEEIVAELRREFDTSDVEDLERTVAEFVDKLLSNGLVTAAN